MIRRILLGTASALIACSMAHAQTLSPDTPPARSIQVLSAPTTQPAQAPTNRYPNYPGYPQAPAAQVTVPETPPTTGPVPYQSLPGPYVSQTAAPPPSGPHQALEYAIAAARRGDAASARSQMMQMSDPVARKIVLWAMVDAAGEAMPFYELDQAKHDLLGWPRPGRRQLVAERAIAAGNLSPQQVVAWFNGADPTTPQGAMALASAEMQLGRGQDAAALIKHWWRTQLFDEDVQNAMQSRFAGFITTEDNVARVDALLYGPQGPAVRDLLPLIPADLQAAAAARMALRNNTGDALSLADSLPPTVANDAGVALERARYMHGRGLDSSALALAARFPTVEPSDAADKEWTFKRQLINAALKAGDFQSAYNVAAHAGLTQGVNFSESEFFAGWLALDKLHQPQVAEGHFANIQRASSTPITQARAFYWRGRAAEAEGDHVQAMAFYGEAARYPTTFYGQLAAEKSGVGQISLGHDPVITPADRAQFDAKDVVRATRMLADLDEKELFRAFVLGSADYFTDPADDAMLVDLARTYGDQDLAMRAVRSAAQHGIVLPERGYPMMPLANVPGGAEPAMVFGITRVESGFDPHVHSGAGARGMMQLLPATAAVMARKLGEPYYAGMLDEPGPNMRLGAYYLGHLIDDFNGSYLMATAAYNAGPGRPPDWASYCGDPRSASVDPVDFIECIPFSETRSYVMRVLEGAQVYRARLGGGSATIRLAEDLKRGGYNYTRMTTPSPSYASAPSGAPAQ